LVAIFEKNPVGEASRGGLRTACCNDGMVVGEDAPVALGGLDKSGRQLRRPYLVDEAIYVKIILFDPSLCCRQH